MFVKSDTICYTFKSKLALAALQWDFTAVFEHFNFWEFCYKFK